MFIACTIRPLSRESRPWSTKGRRSAKRKSPLLAKSNCFWGRLLLTVILQFLLCCTGTANVQAKPPTSPTTQRATSRPFSFPNKTATRTHSAQRTKDQSPTSVPLSKKGKSPKGKPRLVRRVVFYTNGRIEAKATLWVPGDILHGKMTAWYPSGEKQFRGQFRYGKATGFWIFWYPNGKILAKGRYKKGHKVGTWYYYDKDGTLYKKGYKVGTWYYYDKDGTLTKTKN